MQQPGQSWGQQDGVTAEHQVGVLSTDLQVVGRQIAEPLGGRTEEQGDRAGGSDVQGQGVVGETALEEAPAVVLVDRAARRQERV
ncbi:hypothetical protein ACFWUQ_03305 [Streptomyces sp. NPDC058662]|uniref:hypothetical protein n=1 Tax=Streptomyces sp. NPDC058662 TaxID=3346583 RepID=UPI00366188C7